MANLQKHGCVATMTGQATEIMVKEINLALSLPSEPELVN
jgi:hypothetical protein